MSRLPEKLDDPENFTLPIYIGERDVRHALFDLRDSINLMPLYVFKMFGLGEPYPIDITLLLVDRSHLAPNGVIEDVLIKVGKFIILIDFIILDFKLGCQSF